MFNYTKTTKGFDITNANGDVIASGKNYSAIQNIVNVLNAAASAEHEMFDACRKDERNIVSNETRCNLRNNIKLLNA